MYGPAVRCKRKREAGVYGVLHQCIRPCVGAQAPGHHGNPRASEPPAMPRTAIWGSVLECAGKTISPSLIFLPQTSMGKDHSANITFLLVTSTSFLTHAAWGAGFIDLASKSRPPWRTPQAMRAILLASAIASLNRLSRRAAASIQDLRPCFPLPEVGDAPRHTAYDAGSNAKH